MKAPQLATENVLVNLVAPEVERDALLGVEWLKCELGHDTLRLMGVAEKDNQPTSFDQEKKRVASFIDRQDQLNWMIAYDGEIVGSTWVDLEQHEGLNAPSVHIMIGDPAARGKGIGSDVVQSVLAYLSSQGYDTMYSRHLLANLGSARLLAKLGFTDIGELYTDPDGLCWQNMSLEINRNAG